MRELFETLDRWRAEGQAIALATLVQVHGSAPRLPGARMLVAGDGRMAGSVSAGCVEGDVATRAGRVLATGAPELVRYGIADDSELAVGLTCAEIEVLIEPWGDAPAWRTVRRALAAREPVVLVVAIAPGATAARCAALAADGSVTGELDGAAAEAARGMLGSRAVSVLTLGDGPGAGTVFLEAFPRPERLVVHGGNHVAIVLARMAKQVGMDVTVIDARSAYLSRERFPDADALVHAAPAKALAALDLEDAAVVSLTHDLKHDVPALAAALSGGAAYVGAMGSLRTHEKRCRALAAAGVAAADVARIRTPIGLDIGSRTPEEIAVAILAEILAVRAGRDARPLREHGIVHDAGRARRVRGAR
ncbi:MAG: XdhC family protein [Deltaproteobacteria bacterium]|nr:XdhC family protein [Deltaproteobacteria bacterium]